MDDEFIAAVEDEYDRLEEAPVSVEAEPELSSGTIVVEVFDL